MQREIEVKFLDVSHESIREKLKALGANLEKPMRLMRRKLFDYPDSRFQKNNHSRRLRIRDEGGKVFVNYKAKNKTPYVHELEILVESFEDAAKLFEAIGLVCYSFQESRRETWTYQGVEVVLDEWPWLNTYIEIEGPSEEAIKKVASELGFAWKDARFGSVDTAYREQYLGMAKAESIGDLPEVRFNKPLPAYLQEREKSGI